MKLKDIALNAAYVGQRVVKAICVGAQEVWSAVKYIIFKDKVVEQICATNWGDGVGITEEQAAAVTSIGAVFKSNAEITSFDELAEFTGIKVINDHTFYNCGNLVSVIFPNSVNEIKEWTFSGCRKLVSVTLPSELSVMGRGIFQYCISLSQITIPPSVKKINDYTFQSCTSLQTISIHSGITSIGADAFQNDTIKSVRIESILSWLSCELKNKDSTPMRTGADLYLNEEKVTEIAVPGEITSIKNFSFYGCKSLRNITLHDSVTSIGSWAFKASGLENIDIPTSITSIPNEMVNSCGKLHSLTLHGGITSIGDYALQYCSSLQYLKCYSDTPPSLGTSAFSNTTFPIYVPDASVEAYKTASNWSTYASRIKPMSEYVES